VNPKTRREIVFESILERDLAYILLANKRVEDIRDQPEAVEFVDHYGEVRKHTFDFIADLKDGSRTAIAVKPAQKVGSSGIGETLDLIRAQLPRDVADTVELRTGDHITRARAFNARLIFRARRTRSEDDIATIMAVASTLRGTVKLSALLGATRSDGHGFLAAVCLIGDGVLEHVSPGRITIHSLVRLARTTGSHQ
jgi:hypothetical protein